MRDLCAAEHALSVKDLSLTVEMTISREEHFMIANPTYFVDLKLLSALLH